MECKQPAVRFSRLGTRAVVLQVQEALTVVAAGNTTLWYCRYPPTHEVPDMVTSSLDEFEENVISQLSSQDPDAVGSSFNLKLI